MNETLYVKQFELGGMANFSYLIGDAQSGDAAVVDPQDDTRPLETAAAAAGLKVAMVLLTHGHYDHTGGLKHYSHKQGLPVYLSKDEFGLYVPRCQTLKRIKDREKLTVGSFQIECLHTPGHSPGCVCFWAGENLFTGDTLFVEAIGRTDLPGGSAAALFNSLQKIKQLPPDTMIWPGHNYGSSTCLPLRELISRNPFLNCDTEEDFMALVG